MSDGEVNRSLWSCGKVLGNQGLDGRVQVDNEEDAILVASRTDEGLHAPVFDFDFPVRLVPSSSPGHFHVYLDVQITWRAFLPVLQAMRDAGLLQEGFVDRSIERGMTMLLKPGLTKAGLAERGITIESYKTPKDHEETAEAKTERTGESIASVAERLVNAAIDREEELRGLRDAGEQVVRR